MNDIIKALQEKDRFLIAGHINPDGDSLGSSLGLACGLQKMGKEVALINNDNIPEIYKFLPFEEFFPAQIEPEEWNLIVLDCGALDRIGKAAELAAKCKFCINIDHHLTNELFGDLNYVDAEAAAVGQVIYELLQQLSVKLDERIVSALYMALLTDTGGFKYANTDSKVLNTAAALVEAGADPKAIAENVYQQKSFNSLQLVSRALAEIKTACDGQIAWTYVSQEMLEETQCSLEEAEDIIAYLQSLGKAKLVAVFKEKAVNYIRVSLRSKIDLDVSLLAEKFSGGGHARAAGCTIKTSLFEAEKLIIAEMEKMVQDKWMDF